MKNDGIIDVEIQKRMAKANSAFGKLYDNASVTIIMYVHARVNGKLHSRAVALHVLGTESWTVYRQRVKT